MMRFFLDSSVFFAAVYSGQGHARDLIMLAAVEQPSVRLVISQDVMDETRRNLAYHLPEKLPVYDRFVAAVPFEVVNPARRSVVGAARRVAAKDAAIVAAARKAKVDALVAYDARHLLNNPVVASYIRAPVVRPQEAVEMLRGGPPPKKSPRSRKR